MNFLAPLSYFHSFLLSIIFIRQAKVSRKNADASFLVSRYHIWPKRLKLRNPEALFLNFCGDSEMKKIFLILVVFFGFNLSVLAGVDINTASQADLESVKGLGPVKAKAIIEYRNKHGMFKSVEELANVKGIGAGILKQLGDQVSVQEEAVLTETKVD